MQVMEPTQPPPLKNQHQQQQQERTLLSHMQAPWLLPIPNRTQLRVSCQ